MCDRWKEAAKSFERALSLINEDCYETWESTFLNLGHCYRKQKKYRKALVYYNRAFHISPRDPTILSAIGFTYHLIDNLEKAIEYYHQVLAMMPNDTFANDMLHRALEQSVYDKDFDSLQI